MNQGQASVKKTDKPKKANRLEKNNSEQQKKLWMIVGLVVLAIFVVAIIGVLIFRKANPAVLKVGGVEIRKQEYDRFVKDMNSVGIDKEGAKLDLIAY